MESTRKQTSALRSVLNALAFAYILVASGILRLLPRWAMMALAWVTGLAAYWIRRHDRRVAMANLDIVLGDSMSSSKKARIVRRTFQRMAGTVLGLVWARRMTRRRVDQLVDLSQAVAILDDLEARKKGVVIAAAHYGDWELLAYAAGLWGKPIIVVAESISNERLASWIVKLREGSGNRMIPPRFALLKLFRGLRDGGRIAISIDVNGRRGRGGVWLDFFGRKVFNGAGMAELALRTGSAVIFVALRPLPGGRHRLICRGPVEFTPTGDHPADVRALSQQVLDYCRDLILEDPEPWLWTYKRWKRKPAEESEGYPFYAKYARIE